MWSRIAKQKAVALWSCTSPQAYRLTTHWKVFTRHRWGVTFTTLHRVLIPHAVALLQSLTALLLLVYFKDFLFSLYLTDLQQHSDKNKTRPYFFVSSIYWSYMWGSLTFEDTAVLNGKWQHSLCICVCACCWDLVIQIIAQCCNEIKCEDDSSHARVLVK